MTKNIMMSGTRLRFTMMMTMVMMVTRIDLTNMKMTITTTIMMFADQARWRVKPRLKRTAPGGHHCRPAPQSFIFYIAGIIIIVIVI